MDSEEDDPVVMELDVYLSKQLSDSLYLFQYPVRPANMPYDEVNHLSARMKPKQLKVEMELAMNTNCDNYDTSKGEQIAINVDGADCGADAYYKSGKMDKQLLSSAPVGVDTKRYAIGSIRNGELHLTPLTGILQLRPSFSYLDRAEARQQKRNADHDGESSQDEDDVPVKVLAPKFAPKETEDAKAKRMASYEFLRNQEEDEQWVNLRYVPITDPQSRRERDNLLADRSNPNPLSEFYMTEQEYLEKLMPAQAEEKKGKHALPSNVVSLTDIKNQPVEAQIRALLGSAKVMRFSQLLSLLPKTCEPAAVVKYVQHVGILVQGCWVIKSDVLYEKNETLQRARDYIMWRFTQSPNVTRKEINAVVKLSTEDENEILSQLACRRRHWRDWEFKMPYDHEFVNRHADVEQRQKLLWEQKYQLLASIFSIKRTDAKPSTTSATAPSTTGTRTRRNSRNRKKSGEKSMSDQSDTDGESLKVLKIDVPKLKEPSSVNEGSSKKRKVSFSIADDNNEADFLDDIISKDPADSFSALASADDHSNVNISDIVMEDLLPLPIAKIKLESNFQHSASHSKEIEDALAALALEKLKSRTVLNLADMKLQFQLRLAELPPGHLLGSGISDQSLEQAMVQAGALRLSFARGGEAVFILTERGDSLDPVRKILIDMLTVKPSLMLKQLKKKLEENECAGISEASLKQVLKEYCTSYNNSWYLKGTAPEKK